MKTKVVGVASKSERTKPIIKGRKEHCDWLILLLLLPTPTISGFHEIANDGVVSEVGRRWRRPDSPDSDF